MLRTLSSTSSPGIRNRERRTSRRGDQTGMEPKYIATLMRAREQADEEIENPRERAIIVRYIEDALCRARAAPSLGPLTPVASRTKG